MATPEQIDSWIAQYATDGTRAAVVAGVLIRLGTPPGLARQRAQDAVAEGLTRTLARFRAAPTTFDEMTAYPHFSNYVTVAAIHWARTEHGRRPGGVALPDDLIAPEGPDPDSTLDARAAVDALPADDRELLRLKYEEGRTLQAIAGLRGWPLHRVWSRLRAIHEILREKLGSSE